MRTLHRLVRRPDCDAGGRRDHSLLGQDHTDSLRWAIDETKWRREIQQKYNDEDGIEPATIIKSVDSDLKMSNLDYLDFPMPG